MLKIYNSENDIIKEVTDPTKGTWINLVNPTAHEIEYISNLLDIYPDFINPALDKEERSRFEQDEMGNFLILVDTPYIDKQVLNTSKSKRKNKHKINIPVMYSTLPIGIIYTEKVVLTVCLIENLVLENFIKNNVKTFYTFKKVRFILQILYKNASLYLFFLKKIETQSSIIENELHKSMKNKELIQLLTLEKSLVYFSTSLKSNELAIKRLSNYSFISSYEDDIELIDDIIIENKQAIEMSKIYSDILSGTMDAFASIISNNLNIVMKSLTSITIIMAIPTIISSFFGMNVIIPFTDYPYAFLCIVLISILICLVVWKIMSKKNML